ncbi:hypothetical protein EDF46_3582 [Frondihabitans sp. PhB188]|nr:hypothetical protein EDF46_3582 [Frondihabitans sp. PhB188]
MIQNVTQNGNVTEYAAIIDMGDGSAPFLLKGGDSQAAAGTTQSDREQLLTTLKSVLADLPSSLEQARAWATANAWSPYGAEEEAAPSRRLDATA